MTPEADRPAEVGPEITRSEFAELDLDAIAVALSEFIGMALDVRKLKPAEVLRVLNSTPLGECLDSRKLKRHRDRAGVRIGDEKTVDLMRYAAWLHSQKHLPRLSGYEAQKEAARVRQAEQSLSGRDIGELPPVADLARRDACERNFRLFCETYFAATFPLAWSDDHLRVISLIERVAIEGGMFSVAMPRGNGKTSLAEVGALWSILYGHRGYVAIIGPEEGHAKERIKSIRTELEHNDLLAADFPAVCVPIRKLDGINQRRLVYRGETIRMEFTANRVVLPNIEDPHNRAGQAVIESCGITGQIRGMNYKRTDGRSVRPSLVIVDDPQTRESAHSPSQCALRERILNGDILGLAGPNTRISAIVPCTVICPDDLADRILDRTRNPQWQGERTKMVYEWPTAEAKWAKYADMRKRAQREQRQPIEANEFYRQNRESMDAGSRVAWEARKNADELSAIQHAWNIRIDRGDAAFFSEFQNEPLPEELGGEGALTADQIAGRMNGYKRAIVPMSCSHLTAFIDVQQKAMFYIVCAWEPDFTGYVVAYGTEPDQKSTYFTLRDIRRTISVVMPGAGLEGAIYGALERLTKFLMAREWRREDGMTMRIDRCLIDANWGLSTDTVFKFCRETPFAANVMPSHGRGIGASSRPMDQYQRRPGERHGLNWYVPVATGKRSVRHVDFDVNFWKSFVHTRLSTAIGDPGALTLHASSDGHRMLADHLTSEYRIRTQGRGRMIDEWKLPPHKPDNHWFDCVVGAAVAASMCGGAIPGTDRKQFAAKRKRVSFAELQRKARSA